MFDTLILIGLFVFIPHPNLARIKLNVCMLLGKEIYGSYVLKATCEFLLLLTYTVHVSIANQQIASCMKFSHCQQTLRACTETIWYVCCSMAVI